MEITFDLETTAIDPNAGVMQIAAVAWMRGGEQFEICEEFNQGIDLRDLFSRKEEFTFDDNTAHWWGEQEEKARAAMLDSSPDLLVDAVNNFSCWITDIFNDEENTNHDLHIWAQGSDFDIPKLQHLFKVVNTKLPWKYSQVRCARTLALEAGQLFYPNEPKQIYSRYPAFQLQPETAPHDALYDASRTAYTTWNILKELYGEIRK